MGFEAYVSMGSAISNNLSHPLLVKCNELRVHECCFVLEYTAATTGGRGNYTIPVIAMFSLCEWL